MIYTITLNPALDYFMYFNNKFELHQTSQKTLLLPGGKGVNASKVLLNLGIANKAITASGGILSSKFIELAKNQKIDILNVKTGTEIRINVKSNFKNSTYEQNHVGYKIDGNKLNINLRKMLRNINENDTLMIMGSLPKGYSYEQLLKLVKFIKNRKSKIIFDLSISKISELLAFNPEIIKPNIKELENMFNTSIKSKNDLNKYADKILQLGAKRVLVSMDKKGSFYKDKNNTYLIDPIKIDEVNASGAGDSMIAGFVYALHENKTIEDSLKFAAGAGTATAATEWIATKSQIVKYKRNIKLRRWSE